MENWALQQVLVLVQKKVSFWCKHLTWGEIPWRHNHLDGEQKLVRGDNVIKTVPVVGGESFGLLLSDMI